MGTTFGFNDESYSKKRVSETAVAVQGVTTEATASGIAWSPMTMGTISLQINGADFYAQDLGRLKVKKAGFYRVTAHTEISTCTSSTTTIDLGVTSSNSIIARGSAAADAGSFQGVITAGPEIVQLDADARLGLQLRARGGSATAKASATKLIIEHIADA